ncbi:MULTISPECIES: NUDIX hydrolase [Micromonospora]|uniref:NUDIX hydrolase n=1 Tax=Micromonospora chalcea TaxID=1874 RepID=A0ABX9YAG8_MICCH|nr:MULTISPECIES: NUDIX hydrolase [Micromonospora]EWM68576.1 NUDIX hydrolase [Micromonospora sp. M42]MBQ1069400.1 NUDIX hydrolase [Micromonospora sp. D75]MCK1806311.1 NUDIX hydrolase [Micromonospora sp. R42106]MCK1831064.1 NUDIX hydrolase [Micromonospora sp. R42003]MCK1842550.1 NUDIX hydrolase [Micromonospora sp. R42004]
MSPLTWAAAAVVTDASGRLLLCGRSEGARRWGLPGGRLRHDESPVDAVVRAVRTETGWAVAPADLVGLYRVTGPPVPAPSAGRCGARPDVLVHVFRAGPADAGPAGEPATGCLPRWWPPQELPDVLTPTTRAAIADALAGRAGVLRHTTAADALTPPGDGQPGDGQPAPPGQRASEQVDSSSR